MINTEITHFTQSRIKLCRQDIIDLLSGEGAAIPTDAQVRIYYKDTVLCIDDYPVEVSWQIKR